MTDQEFIKKWVGFCAANGITAQPTIETGDGMPIDGYVPPTYIVWHTATGTLSQGVSILQMTDQPSEFVTHVQFAYGIAPGLRVSWNDYLNPPTSPAPDGSDPMVGDVFDPSRRLFYVKGSGVQEGATYRMPSGRQFVAVRIAGPFTLHWQEK